MPYDKEDEGQRFGSYSSKDFKESEAADITAWKLARHVIEHENELVNHRITWFLSTQVFLLTSFFVFVAYSDKPFVENLDALSVTPLLFFVIGFLAIYMCLVTRHGLALADIELDIATNHFNALAEEHGFKRTPPLHVRPGPSLMDLRHLPVVTIVLWIVVELVCGFVGIPYAQEMLERVTVEYAMLAVAALGLLAIISIVYYTKKQAGREGERNSLRSRKSGAAQPTMTSTTAEPPASPP